MVHELAAFSLARALEGRTLTAVSVKKVWVALHGGRVSGFAGYTLRSKGARSVQALCVRVAHSPSAAAERSVRDVKARTKYGCPSIRVHDAAAKDASDGRASRYLVLYSPEHAVVAAGGVAAARRALRITPA